MDGTGMRGDEQRRKRPSKGRANPSCTQDTLRNENVSAWSITTAKRRTIGHDSLHRLAVRRVGDDDRLSTVFAVVGLRCCQCDARQCGGETHLRDGHGDEGKAVVMPSATRAFRIRSAKVDTRRRERTLTTCLMKVRRLSAERGRLGGRRLGLGLLGLFGSARLEEGRFDVGRGGDGGGDDGGERGCTDKERDQVAGAHVVSSRERPERGADTEPAGRNGGTGN